jgi:hypothetical protein
MKSSAPYGQRRGLFPSSFLALLLLAGVLTAPLCAPSAAGTQTITQTGLPDIRNSSGFPSKAEFFDVPSASTLSVTFDVTFTITPPTPGRLKVIIFPGPVTDTGVPPRADIDSNGVIIPAVAVFPVWDHERLVVGGQPVSHIHGVAALPSTFDGKPLINAITTEGSDPPTYDYTVQVIYDNPGDDFSVVATFDSCSLIVDPINQDHIGPPTVNIFGGSHSEQLPTDINYGDALNLFATAHANPSPYTIARLGIIINTAEPIVRGGSLAPLLRSQVVSQSGGSGASAFYQPPILAPGNYTIVVRAVDSAGFYQTISRPLTVHRLFGLFSVSNLVPIVNSDSIDENCPECNSTTFTATINYYNGGTTPSADLRIRLVEVPSASFLDFDGPPLLPDPKTPSDAFVGAVHSLAVGEGDEVAVSGIIDAPIQFPSGPSSQPQYINFHVYAVLDEFIGGQWLPVDSLKVVDGVQLHPMPFGGPGDGSNMPPSGNGTAGLATLSSVTINGGATIASLGSQQFTATGSFTNSSVTINSPVTWQLVDNPPEVHIDASSGLLQVDHVGTDTVIQVSATMTVNGQTQTEIASVTIKAGPPFKSISTRGFIATNNGVLIGGFSISGTVPKPVLVRAIGPSLSAYFPNPLLDPTLSLFDASGHQIVANNDWATAPNSSQIPISLRPADAKESAILVTLAPGEYTAIVAGNNGSQGIGLVQVYDQDQSIASQLDAISTRGFIATNNGVLIGGFTVSGTASKPVLVRAIGPSLSAYFPNPLTDPTLSVYNASGQLLAVNNDWATAPNANQIPTGLRPADSKESAILLSLAPGDYTAIVAGNNGSQGIGLVQVYD